MTSTGFTGRGSALAISFAYTAVSTATHSPKRNSPARPCSQEETRPTTTSVRRTSASSARPWSAISQNLHESEDITTRVDQPGPMSSWPKSSASSVAWVTSGRSGKGPGDVKVGDSLPVRPMGPHTQVQFAIEYRTFMFSVWGTQFVEGTFYGNDAGWIKELVNDDDDDMRPNKIGGTERGPASGHTNAWKASLVGLPRHYGYGSSMGAWVIDYVAYWAGDNGFVRHSKINYRYPTFEGDVAILKGVVEDIRWEPLLGVHLAKIGISMVNQDDVALASGYVEVELPIT